MAVLGGGLVFAGGFDPCIDLVIGFIPWVEAMNCDNTRMCHQLEWNSQKAIPQCTRRSSAYSISVSSVPSWPFPSFKILIGYYILVFASDNRKDADMVPFWHSTINNVVLTAGPGRPGRPIQQIGKVRSGKEDGCKSRERYGTEGKSQVCVGC